jgi:competence protein ComEA
MPAASPVSGVEPGDALPAPAPRFHVVSYVLGLSTALALVGGTLLLLRRPEPPPIVLHPPPTATPAPTPVPTATPGSMVVFVSGAVQQPGMVALAPDARVGDAIDAAGGLLADADPALVNQAQPIYDGAQVHVPAAGAAPVLPDAVALPPAGLSGALPTATPPATRGGAPGLAGGLVNVNTATAAELESLPGIGVSKAQDIIAGRPYTVVDDLDRVPGIGTATLERLRPLVTVE